MAGFSGLAAGGAKNSLEDLVKQALLQEQMDAQQQERVTDNARADRSLNLQEQWHGEDRARADQQRQDTLTAGQRNDDRADTERRDRSNRWGVEDMMRQAAAMQPKPTKLTKVTTRGPDGRPVAKGVTDEELAAGVEEYREPKATGGGDKAQWLLRDGKPVHDAPRPGDIPYDRTRTGERPVLSSDANNIADIDNSIQMLDSLEGGIGKTGTSSWMEAKAPSFITDATGYGADAKVRQSMINGAKQIIGKALEGGVLRKEDEAKYAEILPTIQDRPDVAQGKIAKLRATLQKKRETTLEALGSAGYGVDRFNKGGAAPKMAPSHESGPAADYVWDGTKLVPKK